MFRKFPGTFLDMSCIFPDFLPEPRSLRILGAQEPGILGPPEPRNLKEPEFHKDPRDNKDPGDNEDPRKDIRRS